MTLRLENPNGQAIHSFGDWLPLAHPPDAAGEWKDFRSAKELARAYFRTGSPAVPEEMAALLNSRPETQGFQIDTAVAGKSIIADTHWAKKRYSDEWHCRNRKLYHVQCLRSSSRRTCLGFCMSG